MTVSAAASPRPRGACPGLSAPMPTGDGLLVRFISSGPIPLDAFDGLCAAARAHGNGVIEITARGSIQVRGLQADTAPHFAAAIAALGIAADDGIPVLSNPLSGLDPEELIEASEIARNLRRTLALRGLAARLPAKVSVIVDGGGRFGLDEPAADIRLCATYGNGAVGFDVSVGGTAATAAPLGHLAAHHGVEAATRLLEVIARHGRERRARDILGNEGPVVFRAAIADIVSDAALRRAARRCGDAIGMHSLRDGTIVCGIGFAFGHADGDALERLVATAREAGARALRAAPQRALLAIGLARSAAADFAAAADRLGFIARGSDPRRRVIACAGAPICVAAHIPARALAPRIAAEADIDDTLTIHVSGCAKGCAHPTAAELTIVGTVAGCAMIRDGTSRDVALTTVAAEQVPATVATMLRQRESEKLHG